MLYKDFKGNENYKVLLAKTVSNSTKVQSLVVDTKGDVSRKIIVALPKKHNSLNMLAVRYFCSDDGSNFRTVTEGDILGDLTNPSKEGDTHLVSYVAACRYLRVDLTPTGNSGASDISVVYLGEKAVPSVENNGDS